MLELRTRPRFTRGKLIDLTNISVAIGPDGTRVLTAHLEYGGEIVKGRLGELVITFPLLPDIDNQNISVSANESREIAPGIPYPVIFINGKTVLPAITQSKVGIVIHKKFDPIPFVLL